jgi:hypothetical protein
MITNRSASTNAASNNELFYAGAHKLSQKAAPQGVTGNFMEASGISNAANRPMTAVLEEDDEAIYNEDTEVQARFSLNGNGIQRETVN